MPDFNQILLLSLGAMLASAGWMIQRYITGSHQDEKIVRLDMALKIKEQLERQGISEEEAHLLADRLANGSAALSEQSLKQIEETLPDQQDVGHSFTVLDTTAAMGAQLDARLQVLDAEIDELMLKLEMLCDPEFWTALQEAHEAWKTYREAEGHAAYEEMAGGTGRTVNALATSISVTEDRISYLKGFVAEKIELYGEM